MRQIYNFFLTYQMAPYKSIKIRFEEFSYIILFKLIKGVRISYVGSYPKISSASELNTNN